MSFRLFFHLACRYLVSVKGKTVVNLISWISVVGIMVSTIALVVVMSVYNGIGLLTQSLFNVFDPELLIEPSQGKTFRTSEIPYDAICNTPGVSQITQIAEENAWITLKQAESIVQLRGVDDSYGAASGLDTLTYDGSYTIKMSDRYDVNEQQYYLLLGWNIMVRMGVNSMTNIPIAVHIPKRGTAAIGFTMDEAFNNGYALVSGAFRIQEEVDNMYAVTHIDFVRQLMDYKEDECTALAVSLGDSKQIKQVKKQLQALLGDGFSVRDRYEQKPLYYKVFRSERLGVFLILSLIVLIAALNLIASLSLLIINKRKDMATLRALGMERIQLQKVFITEGLLIAVIGVVVGLLLGSVICAIQQRFGIVKLGPNAVVEAFPVAMRVIDFAATFVVVMTLSTLVVLFTVKRARV